jgi:hypothetical protein
VIPKLQTSERTSYPCRDALGSILSGWNTKRSQGINYAYLEEQANGSNSLIGSQNISILLKQFIYKARLGVTESHYYNKKQTKHQQKNPKSTQWLIP